MVRLKVLSKQLITLIPALSLSSLAYADKAVELDEMTITSTRAETKIEDSPQVVTIIEREEIEQQLKISPDASQVLSSLLPSFTPARQKLSSAGETFRGRAPLFLIDGIPQSNPLRDAQRDGHTIDLSMVERIEVIHGASAIHGLGATGGIINFITRRPTTNKLDQNMNVQMTSPTSEVDGDTFGYRTSYGLRGSQKDVEYALGLSYEKQGLFLDADDNAIGVDNTQGDIMASRSYDLFGKLGYWLTDNQNIELQLNRYELDGDNDYLSVPGDRNRKIPATSTEQTPPGDAPHNEVTTTSIKFEDYDLAGMHFTAQAYRQEFEALFGAGIFGSFQDPAIAPVGTLYDQSQTSSIKKGAKFTLTKDDLFKDKLTLTAGMDILHDTTEQELAATNRSWVPETTFKNYAPFLQAQLKPVDMLVLNAGIRHEKAKLDVDDFQTIHSTNNAGGVTVEGGNPDFSETLYNAGIVISPLSWFSVFANYSEGFGMPDVGRVLRGIGTPGQDVDDFLNLQPVLTDNREIGFRIDWDPIDFEVSYYESDSDLGSRLENIGGTYFVRREKTEINGVETTLGFQANDDHRVELSYSYIRGRYDSDDNGSIDSDLDGNNIPPNRLIANWNASWTPKLSSFVQLSHNFDRSFDEEPGDPEIKFDGYTLVDASLAYQLPKGTVNLAFANLLDEDYFDYYSQTANTLDERYFKGRGRTVTLGYSLDF
ncbi:TonB-dependent receptor [Methylophaga sp.]|uniref:TonB-dependent receptor n=1 Tax=Methylophaga sp. TaxID=2024840 RepID=UPI0013FE5D31|nr:TonB-dependent receptor [Methylophaga sp.]MTI63941.1 TonB-dependent receptor [Methylophaga sp.]